MKFIYPPVVRTFDGLGIMSDDAMQSIRYLANKPDVRDIVKYMDSIKPGDRVAAYKDMLEQAMSARKFDGWSIPDAAKKLTRGQTWIVRNTVLNKARSLLSQADIDSVMSKVKKNKQHDNYWNKDQYNKVAAMTPDEARRVLRALVDGTPVDSLGLGTDAIQNGAYAIIYAAYQKFGNNIGAVDEAMAAAAGISPPAEGPSASAAAASRAEYTASLYEGGPVDSGRNTAGRYGTAAGKLTAGKPSTSASSTAIITSPDAVSTTWPSPAEEKKPTWRTAGDGTSTPAVPRIAPQIDPTLIDAYRDAMVKFNDLLVRYTQEGSTAAAADLDRAMNEYGSLLKQVYDIRQKRLAFYQSMNREADAKEEQAIIARMDAEFDRIQKRPQVSAKATGTAAPQTTAAENGAPPPYASGPSMPSAPPPSVVYGPSYAPSAPPAAEPTSGGVVIPGLVTPEQQYAELYARQAAKKGLSTGAWVGIGVGAVALVGVGIWAATRKKA